MKRKIERIEMISKIVLNGVASYKKEAVLDTDKKVNLLYGLNGTGKSTFSEFLYDQTRARFSQCSIEGLEENDTVLVYNQQFVQETFYVPAGIHGIFTLSKGNADAQKVIDTTSAEVKKLTEQKRKIEEKKIKNEQKHLAEIEEYKKQVWKIKTEYTGGDRVLAFCLDGLKGNKDTLFKHIISLEKPEGELDYSVDDLKKEAQQLQGEAQSRQLLSKVLINVEDIEQSELLSKVIVGDKNSSIASLIETLGNSDWVNTGIKYVHIDGEKGVCPFCQQKTITQNFLEQINAYFDESYNRDKSQIEQMISRYDAEIKKATDFFNAIKDDSFLEKNKAEIESLSANLISVLEHNLNTLREKAKTPSIQVSLQPINEIIESINSIIKNANNEITLYNQRIADIKGSKSKIRDSFWCLMRKEYNSVIELYAANEKAYEQSVKNAQKELQTKTSEINTNTALIEENRKKTVNIDEAVENIKNGLIDIGITDFTIEKYSEEEALYRLKREDLDEDVFKTLSEGEKMVISFLYFIELCKGESTAEKASNKKIVVIDDPISSLSHIYVFNIGRLIHNEFLRTKKYDQLFILTHSLYFFYELTNTNHKERKETQKLFRICKNTESSYFEDMKYEDIQNDYQAYWHIIKDEKQSPALIANCMRNVMEYFFNFVEKQDFAQVFQRPELQENRYMAFNRYMNRESHSKGQNIFDIKEFNYDSFREAFKKVFETEGYIDHYNKMIGL
ncbi:AAA family ATPase [uncultured Megasphaera sp.]|uniref:AAA family ATPase n=1 Tax=uncultured Megasphaera sp. TaxID=165188 RepID=UPI002593F24C|nr:AAA family ATPase [uncultured Megasphaera sp.]